MVDTEQYITLQTSEKTLSPLSGQFIDHLITKLPEEDRSFAKEGFDLKLFQTDQILDPDYIHKMHGVHKVSEHESGHELGAKSLGHEVIEVSVIPNGNTLGFVRSRVSSGISALRSAREKITVFCAGLVGEEISGQHNHSGCGYDLSVARLISQRIAMFTGESASKVFSEGLSSARKTINEVGSNPINQRAWYHMQKAGYFTS